MNIDIAQLKADRKTLDERILEAKKQLRTTWTKPMGSVQVQLLILKSQITELHILRAHARGRVHLANNPDRCREVAERMMARYQKKEEVAA
jgi:hypothetical protein